MPDVAWPTSSAVHAAVAERLRRLLAEHAGPVVEVARRALSQPSGVLSDQPHSLTCVLVPGACLAAGADWRQALWPAVAAECMMAAADLFDDAADGDADTDAEGPGGQPAGVLLTAGAGLLSLAGATVVRVVEDGVPPSTAVALAESLGREFLSAANGQAANLEQHQHGIDTLSAYQQAAAKSGPLGSLIARLGARTATDDPRRIDLLAEFGRRLAVRSQLLNDAHDASPEVASNRADVRAGARTVPLVFAGSEGAPHGLTGTELADWEQRERLRVATSGGLMAAVALAEAERVRAVQTLDDLERLGCSVTGLRALIA